MEIMYGRAEVGIRERKEICIDMRTRAIDPMVGGEVLEVMADWAQEGQTMIVVTKEIDFVD